MITKITGEQPFQVLTNNFSISPSNEGYTLQISADGKQYSNLFTVGAGVTRLVTGVAANSYYRLSGNQSNVSINWMKVCVTEGGGGASGTELSPVSEFPLNAEAGTVVALVSGDTYGIYQYDGNEWNEAGADVDLSPYWTSAETQSALTAVEDHLFDVEEVTASALTELHEGLLEVSATTAGKADAANITGGLQPVPTVGHTWFPVWNKQGIITGTSVKGYAADSYINGKQKRFVDTNGNGGVTIYAPQSAGTAGDILVSTGSGAPVWSAMPVADVTKAYVDSGDTALQDQIDTMDEVVSQALVDINERKADAANVTANSELKFPAWNEQGIITGTSFINAWYPVRLDINGHMGVTVNSAGNERFGPIYAPVSAGTAGQILVSSGPGNAPVWSAVTGPDMSNYWNSAETKTYVDNRLDGYEEESTITITSTLDAENLDVWVAVMGWMGASFSLYLTDADVEVATLNNEEMRMDGPQTYVPGVSDALGDYRYGFDTSAVLTENMLGQKFSLSQGGEGKIELNETNFPVSYPQYFVLDKANMEGWFTNSLSTSVYVPGVYDDIDNLNNTKVESQDIKHIVKLTQSEYDQLATKDPETFYIILNNN